MITSAQVVKSPKFGLFRGLIATKPYVPHQNSRTKDTFLGCRLAPEMIPIAQNGAVWAAGLSKLPTLEYHILGSFGDPETPCAEIEKKFTSVCMRKAICVCC